MGINGALVGRRNSPSPTTSVFGDPQPTRDRLSLGDGGSYGIRPSHLDVIGACLRLGIQSNCAPRFFNDGPLVRLGSATVGQ